MAVWKPSVNWTHISLCTILFVSSRPHVVSITHSSTSTSHNLTCPGFVSMQQNVYYKKAETGSTQIVASKENTGQRNYRLHLNLCCDVFGLILKELFWNWVLAWDLCLVCEESGKETGYYKLIGGCLLPQHSVGLGIFISFTSTRHLGIKIFHWKGGWQ